MRRRKVASQLPRLKSRHCSTAGTHRCRQAILKRWLQITRIVQSFCPLCRIRRVSRQPKRKITFTTSWKISPLAKLTCEPSNSVATLRLMPAFTHSLLPGPVLPSTDVSASPIGGAVRNGLLPATIPQPCQRRISFTPPRHRSRSQLEPELCRANFSIMA